SAAAVVVLPTPPLPTQTRTRCVATRRARSDIAGFAVITSVYRAMLSPALHSGSTPRSISLAPFLLCAFSQWLFQYSGPNQMREPFHLGQAELLRKTERQRHRRQRQLLQLLQVGGLRLC